MSVAPADLLLCLAQRLDDLGFALWSPSGAYPAAPDKPVITIGKLPQDIVSAISLNHYFTDPEPELVTSTPLHFVQLEFREPGPSPLLVIERERAALKLLHTMLPGNWPGGMSPLSVTFSSAAPADPENGSWTKTANYSIRLNPGSGD